MGIHQLFPFIHKNCPDASAKCTMQNFKGTAENPTTFAIDTNIYVYKVF